MPAFSDQDGDDLTFSVAVADSAGDSVDWLQIDNKGRLTNKEGMLPERGVYTVTVTATDEPDADGNTNSTDTSFKLAVAISDDGDRDNDRPDIRDVIEYDYTEGDGARKVAEFTIRDDDLEIAPHPYGLHEVKLSGTYASRFKLVELGDEDNDPQTAQYAIWTKSAAELAVGADGKALTTPVKPIDYDAPNGVQEEIDITVTVTDGNGGTLLDEAETDSRDITIDIDDAPDAPPAFSDSIEHDDVKVGRTTDKDTKLGTTTLTVNQEESDKIVVVVQLSEVWSDTDSDEDDLEFTADTSDLPDWVTVYGPDDWEDIHERRRDVDEERDGPGIRDGDQVVVIVIDRTTGEDGDNVQTGTGLVSFTLTAEDGDDNSTTETISINVSDTNVAIVEDDDDPVVTITGTASGLGEVNMAFGADQDPDLDEPGDAVLVLYTWSTLAEEDDEGTTEVDESTVPTVIMVSTSPQSLALDGNSDRMNDYIGSKIIASVEYYEVDPETGMIAKSEPFEARTEDFIEAPDDDEVLPADISFDFTTTEEGEANLQVAITVANATATGPVVVLQVSESKDGGWITSTRDESPTLSAVAFAVDSDADGENGDGGGLYYRVVLTYGPDDERTTVTSHAIQLGDVETPDGDTEATDIIGGSPSDRADIGDTLRINTGGEDAEVQWQLSNTMGGYDDIDGATSLTLTVTNDQAGRMLRAKVTYMTNDDDPDTDDADESTYPSWVEYTELVPVSGEIENNAPATTQTDHEIRVKLPATTKVGQPAAIVSDDSIEDLFFDSDDNDLTYSITEVTPNLADDMVDGTDAGYDAELSAGMQVYRSYTTTRDSGTMVETMPVLQQTLAIDKSTGEITYFTDMSQTHDGNAEDGAGNTLVVMVSATDGIGETPASVTIPVTVRINVAPTAIEMQSFDEMDIGDAANLPVPKLVAGKHTAGTALQVEDGEDANSVPDDLTFMDDTEYDAVKVADLNVMDQNLTTDDFGTHKITLGGKGANMFEARETDDDETDGSTWGLWLKKDATFNFEALKGATDTGSTTLYITMTATDKGGLSTKGVFTVKVMDVKDTDADLEAAEKVEARKETAKEKEDKAKEEADKIKDEGPDVPGLKDDSDDGDDDGAVPPPPEDATMSFAPGDDLLDSFVLAIDDIDVA